MQTKQDTYTKEIYIYIYELYLEMTGQTDSDSSRTCFTSSVHRERVNYMKTLINISNLTNK
jgi:hypothetical protein